MCTDAQRADHARQLLSNLLSDRETYHNQKETMAHACVLVQIGLAASVMTGDGWAIVESSCLFLLGYMVIWLLIHIYMRWQLGNRRCAAIHVEAIRTLMGRWVVRELNRDDLEPHEKDPPEPPWLREKCDWFLPCFQGGHPRERSARGYPRALIDELKLAEERTLTWNLWFGEMLPTAISILMLLAIVLRAITDC